MIIEVEQSNTTPISPEPTPSREPTSPREVISAVNEVAGSLWLDVQIARDRQRRGLPISDEQIRQQNEYQLFADSRRAVLGHDEQLPQTLISDTHIIRFEDPANPSGPAYLMEEGIDIRGLLPQIDRIIEGRRNISPEEANLDHYTRLKQVLLDNSKPFMDLYFPGKSEQELMADPAFYARTLYGARQRLHGIPASEDQIANWMEDLLRRRVELVLPIELKGQPLPPEMSQPEPKKLNRSITEAPRVIRRHGVRVIQPGEASKVGTVSIGGAIGINIPPLEKPPKPLIPRAESPEPVSEPTRIPASEIQRFPNSIRILRESGPYGRGHEEEGKITETVDRLMRTHFGRSLRMDPRILAAALLALGLSALLPGGPRQNPESVPQPAIAVETYNFGERGHSLNGLAEAKGIELNNAELVADARARGAKYSPNLAAKMEASGGGPLPPDDPDFLSEAEKARTVPWWDTFKELFKYFTKKHTPDIVGDELPTKVTVEDPKNTWQAAKIEYFNNNQLTPVPSLQ